MISVIQEITGLESRLEVTTSEKIFLVWSALLGQTLVMPMQQRQPPEGNGAQICALGDPDHVLEVRWP